ncbi:hypothetical protein [Shimwellia blattae]|uniref:Putative membrane protein n=1 Tax=Shimwellia blattae (strain ATCC 29907 / DSM 4481 / JCM 1650 / NBRC 105725 / CDC 9005-74) TaxID=630626 RepID=I2B7W6_SHIBC|nr:hypothetical protein [Shimwellia blattae]AFJ46620.1 putative membrane protein [Shimwellia blattae DSM 4481 = NBRC 105725]VDY64092.1 Uncharacterised protein [Shimwellia blattae]VEC22224.1 Uncharacterised protein [Shimwellia blattae]
MLKNKQHLLLCDAFKEQFGYVPAEIILAQAGGIFLTFQKDFYFIFPFVFKKGSFPVRNMDSEHYDFIKELPNEMVLWLKVKFTLFLVMIVLFFLTIITSVLPI